MNMYEYSSKFILRQQEVCINTVKNMLYHNNELVLP